LIADKHNAASIKLGTTLIQGALVGPEKLQGDYDNFLNQLSGVDIYYYPPGRAFKLLKNHNVDCIFPASTAMFPTSKGYIQSHSVNEVHAYIFTRFPYKSIDEIVGKTIAISRGFSYGGVRERLKANYIELGSELAKTEFFRKGRVDGFVSYKEDVEPLYSAEQLDFPFHIPSRPYYTAKEAFVCVDKPNLVNFVNKINKFIAKHAPNSLKKHHSSRE